MLQEAFAALAATPAPLGANSLAGGFLPLAGAVACATALLAAGRIAKRPTGRHLSEFVGEAAVTGAVCLALLAGAGLCGWKAWRNLFPKPGEPYFRVLVAEGLADAKLVRSMERLMGDSVRQIHNQEAQIYEASDGRMSFDFLHANILDRVVESERSGFLPAGSYNPELFTLVEANLVDEYFGQGGREWRDSLDKLSLRDSHDYRGGRNPEVYAFSPKQIAEMEAAVLAKTATPWELVRKSVLPVLASNESLKAAPRGGVDVLRDGVYQPYGPDLSYYYAFYDPEDQRLVPVKSADFATYGVNPGDFASQALENLGGRLEEEIEFEPMQLPGGGEAFAISGQRPGFAAALLLLPDLHERMRKVIPGPFVALVPAEDRFIAGPFLARAAAPGEPRRPNAAYLDALPEIAREASADAQGREISRQPLIVWDGGMAVFKKRFSELPSDVARAGF